MWLTLCGIVLEGRQEVQDGACPVFSAGEVVVELPVWDKQRHARHVQQGLIYKS